MADWTKMNPCSVVPNRISTKNESEKAKMLEMKRIKCEPLDVEMEENGEEYLTTFGMEIKGEEIDFKEANSSSEEENDEVVDEIKIDFKLKLEEMKPEALEDQEVKIEDEEMDFPWSRHEEKYPISIENDGQIIRKPNYYTTANATNKEAKDGVFKTTGWGSSENSEPFKCFECYYSFTKKDSLYSHIRSVHRKLKPFKCSGCDYSCTNNSLLDRHIRSVHIKLKPFKCDECDHSCSLKENLARHIRAVHRKIKPFQCSECDSSFAAKYKLRLHVMSVHRKLKIFQ